VSNLRISKFRQWSFLAGHLVSQCEAYFFGIIERDKLCAEARAAKATAQEIPDIGGPTSAVRCLIDVMIVAANASSPAAVDQWRQALLPVCDAVREEFLPRREAALEAREMQTTSLIDDCQLPAGVGR
jgi:hypothetical protein